MSTLLYAQDEIVVTAQLMRIGHHRYHVSELRGVVTARGPVHSAVVVSLVIAAVEAGLTIPLVASVGVALVWPVAVPAILIPCLVSLVCASRWPPRWELWAWYRGQQTRLFSTRDERRFGQVARAVQRALEATSRSAA